ncbi:hypothetical protein HGA91_06545 [candidate division WWE3 bacterium]|nr:hypothetical protein [candidate division WWE3 bacterium]
MDTPLPLVLDNPILSVFVRSTDAVLYDGPATSVTCLNDTGPFDILPFHVNFISLIQDRVVIQPPDGKSIEFTIGKGIIKTSHNKVTIFWGFETM